MPYETLGAVLLFVAVWVVMNRWILPWFGVRT